MKEEMLLTLLALQIITLVIVFYGTNFRSRAWQIPVYGRVLQWAVRER